MNRVRSLGLALAVMVLALEAQTPAFEAATIKPNPDPNGPRLFQAFPDGRVSLVNQTVRELIYSAYQTQDYRIIGGPNWLSTDRYDVEGKAAGNPPPQQMLLMVRTLLGERFQLSMHNETRQMPIFRLVLARSDGKTGPKLLPSVCIEAQAMAQAQCGNRAVPGVMHVSGATLDTLVNRLGRLPEIARPVINETGLKGQFDFELSYSPDGTAPDAVAIFTALQEQLGLKLEADRGPVEVFVIDRAERPSAN